MFELGFALKHLVIRDTDFVFQYFYMTNFNCAFPVPFSLTISYHAPIAQVVKLVDTPVLGTGLARDGGSSPLLGTVTK